uniref:Carboxyltransferase domain-containing protein n=1 Tax=Thermofilum pendens TaxID=2269 RepID=A0A7C4FAZ3_THEPE
MTIVVRVAEKAFVSPTPLASHDKYAHTAANLLCLNPLMGPAIELRGGELLVETSHPVLAAVTGSASVAVDGRKAGTWSALYVGRSLSVFTEGRAYVSVKGLRVPAERKEPLSSGATLSAEQNGHSGVNSRLLSALKVPPSLLSDNGDWLQAAYRLQRYFEMLMDIVQRGAELVRVNIGGVEYEAWVLEVS